MDKVDIIKQADAYWGFAYTRSRAEKVTAAKLTQAGVLCYLPVLPHAYMMHSTKIVTEVPMFPGYLFLSVSRNKAAEWKKNEKKIVRISLQYDEEGESELIKELHIIQKCEDLAKTQPILVNPGIKHGDKVMITDGSMKGLVAEVIRRDDTNNSIIINLAMLDHYVEYSVSMEELKKITE